MFQWRVTLNVHSITSYFDSNLLKFANSRKNEWKKNSLKRIDGKVNNLESNKKTIITLQGTRASCIEQQRKSPNINLLISMKFLLVI